MSVPAATQEELAGHPWREEYARVLWRQERTERGGHIVGVVRVQLRRVAQLVHGVVPGRLRWLRSRVERGVVAGRQLERAPHEVHLVFLGREGVRLHHRTALEPVQGRTLGHVRRRLRVETETTETEVHTRASFTFASLELSLQHTAATVEHAVVGAGA